MGIKKGCNPYRIEYTKQEVVPVPSQQYIKANKDTPVSGAPC